jgi:hypothetical protein
MAFQYPARRCELAGLMATAKQYSATKQLHPDFGRQHSTFSSFAVRLSPLATLQAGTLPDTCELDIDDQLGVVSRGATCRQGRERYAVKRWQSLVRAGSLGGGCEIAVWAAAVWSMCRTDV